MRVELGRGERAFWVVLFAAVIVHLAAYALLAYPAMPETVPTHWGADGAVDGWGDKAGTLVMAAMPLVVALVMLAVPRLDPKGRNFERFRGVYLGEARLGHGRCLWGLGRLRCGGSLRLLVCNDTRGVNLTELSQLPDEGKPHRIIHFKTAENDGIITHVYLGSEHSRIEAGEGKSDAREDDARRNEPSRHREVDLLGTDHGTRSFLCCEVRRYGRGPIVSPILALPKRRDGLPRPER